MSDTNGSNGNGNEKILTIDVTNDIAFRTAVVQNLQFLVDRTADLPAIKKVVAKHERAYTAAKWLSVPAIAVISAGVKHALAKLGW